MCLAVEITPVPRSWPKTSPPARTCQSEARRHAALTDEWGHSVSDGLFENEFSIFQEWLNSVVICLFCVELNRAPKIMKIFV